jgi:hypothetical protein
MISWDAYRTSLQYKKGLSDKDKNLAKWILKKELAKIEGKYRHISDLDSKKREIDEITKYAEKVIKHVSEENWKEIPTNPEQQTEIQKIIVNTPPFPKGFSFRKDFAKTLFQDPKTGMYWSKHYGMPTLPPEWEEQSVEKSMEHERGPYDYSRGWLYNTIMWFLRFGSSH